MAVPAAPAVAAAGAAVALYLWRRRAGACMPGSGEGGEDGPAFARTHQAPNNWVEALFFFAEALRYMYGETLGRWRTADLLIGLAYLARRDGELHPVADIACQGNPIGADLTPSARLALLDELRTIERYMRYCLALRERRPARQQAVFSSLGIAESDIYVQVPRSGVLRPSYVLLRDTQLKTVVLAVRGTHSMKDMFTSLTGASRPHHMVDGAGVVLGFSHFGMLAAARWIRSQTQASLADALARNPGYSLKIVGHSLGGGTAAMLTMMLRDAAPEFADATCLAIACPACMTLELARSCAGYVTTIINGADIVPTISPGAADVLRADVMASSWYEAFRSDMRASTVVRAVEASLGRVSSATAAATSWTSQRFFSASQNLRACYQRPRAKRRSSGELNWCMPMRGPLRVRPEGSDSDTDSDSDGGAASGRIEVASDWVTQEGAASRASWAGVFGALRAWGWNTELVQASTFAGAGSAPVLAQASRTPGPAAKGRSVAVSRDKAAADREKAAEAAAGRGRGDKGRTPKAAAAENAGRNGSVWSEGVARWGIETSRVVGQRVGATSQAVYRRAGEMLSMSWPQPNASSPLSPSEKLPEPDNMSSPWSPGPSEARRTSLANDLDVDSGCDEGTGRGGCGELPSSLQMDQEMMAVEAAVAAAQLEVDGPPSATPGSMGPSGSLGRVKSLQESAEEEKRKRMTYPAGRILHLVPARLVYNESAEETPQPQNVVRDSPADEAWPDMCGDAAAAWQEGPGSRPQSRGSRHSADDFLTYNAYMADYDGSLVVVGLSSTAQEEPAVQAPPEKYILLENIPQEAYGRIKVGRRMLQDHFIPSYLAALEAAIEAFLAQGPLGPEPDI